MLLTAVVISEQDPPSEQSAKSAGNTDQNFKNRFLFYSTRGCSYNPLLNPLQLPLVTWGASHRALCICASQCQSTVRVWHADAACAHGRVFWGRVRSSASAFWLENGSKKSRSGPPEGWQGISAGRKGGGATSGEPERTDPRSPIRQGARTQIFIRTRGRGTREGERESEVSRQERWMGGSVRPPSLAWCYVPCPARGPHQHQASKHLITTGREFRT